MGYTPTFDAIDSSATTDRTFIDLGRSVDATRMKREMLRFAGLVMDPISGATTVRGKVVQLATAERELLSVMLRRAGQIVSRERLSATLGLTSARVDELVDELRKELKSAGASCLPCSAEGLGYILWRC